MTVGNVCAELQTMCKRAHAEGPDVYVTRSVGGQNANIEAFWITGNIWCICCITLKCVKCLHVYVE